ncbi:MAG: hypothetical protein VB013_08285 [Anaerolineaceae bacterium]|nr:hypothetical protein [Anaerolineaceae bacterium]
MNVNKRIIEKINEKTQEDQYTRQFLFDLLDKESEGLGWFKSEYKELIKKNTKGWIKNENR